jgi:hypothetical protein
VSAFCGCIGKPTLLIAASRVGEALNQRVVGRSLLISTWGRPLHYARACPHGHVPSLACNLTIKDSLLAFWSLVCPSLWKHVGPNNSTRWVSWAFGDRSCAYKLPYNYRNVGTKSVVTMWKVVRLAYPSWSSKPMSTEKSLRLGHSRSKETMLGASKPRESSPRLRTGNVGAHYGCASEVLPAPGIPDSQTTAAFDLDLPRVE